MLKKEGKRAQFTIFVVLGFVMMIMVFFIIISVARISEMNMKRAQTRAITEFLDSSAVNYYAQTCLESATTTAIDEIFLQGGNLYNASGELCEFTEPGKTHIPINITLQSGINITMNASYIITRNNTCNVIQQRPPQYPLDNTSLDALYQIYETYDQYTCSSDITTRQGLSGFFGLNNLSRLCAFESHNTRPISGIGPSPCIVNWETRETNLSIEQQLERRIMALMNECFNFDFLNELQGNTFSLDGEQEENITIIFNSNTVAVKITYPFIVELVNGETQFLRHNFSYASPLRITKLHNYLMSLLALDTKDIFFNLSQDYQDYYLGKRNMPNITKFYDPAFTIEIKNFLDCQETECESYKYDRVIIVQDTLSQIGGRHLTFAGAIKNRKPALQPIGLESYFSYGYHILVSEGDELVISPQGYDPDEGQLNYSYSGWKETYDEICYLNPNAPDLTIDCQIITSPEPKNLTGSMMFRETFRAANYTTNATDIGFHNVTVYVYDLEGLQDYQRLTILVFDKPEANITYIPPYPGMPDNVTSIEDVLRLEGDIKHSSFINDPTTQVNSVTYNWTIYNDSGDLVKNSTQQNITIPNSTQTNNILIQLIEKLNFTNTGRHLVRLQVEAEYNFNNGEIEIASDHFEMNLTVKACIPHRNTTQIYPYGTSNNPFLNNHTCCAGDIDNASTYTLQDSNFVCFQQDWYGEYNKLKDKANELNKTNELENYTGSSIFTQNYPSLAPQDRNNVFKLAFTRKCDGTRGNICAGDVLAHISLSENCFYNSSLLEQCKGPGTSTSPVNTQLICTSYTSTINNYQSFEKIFGLNRLNNEEATGECLVGNKCSTRLPSGLFNYDGGGPFLCTSAYCNNGECTRSFNCECNLGCGAICDATIPSLWVGNLCSFGGCNNNCGFSLSGQTKCSASQTNCKAQNGTYDFCYTGVGCTANGPQSQQNDFCQTQRVIPVRIQTTNPLGTQDVSLCLTGNTPTCNAGTCTGVTRNFFTCTPGRTPECQQGGPRCCNGNDCVNPTTTFPATSQILEYLI